MARLCRCDNGQPPPRHCDVDSGTYCACGRDEANGARAKEGYDEDGLYGVSTAPEQCEDHAADDGSEDLADTEM